jgi:hypothetical protein
MPSVTHDFDDFAARSADRDLARIGIIRHLPSWLTGASHHLSRLRPKPRSRIPHAANLTLPMISSTRLAASA